MMFERELHEFAKMSFFEDLAELVLEHPSLSDADIVELLNRYAKELQECIDRNKNEN